MLSALFDPEERKPATVSELNADIKATLEGRFASVWVEGEITNFHAAGSGHWYFSLTDGNSFLKAACFKGQNYRIRFRPSDGLLVRVRGRITTYEKRGEYQLLVESLEPVGEGALVVAFEQIKAKLAAEGIFDESRKRPLPPYPRRVGVVTSPTGAALHDILSVLDRRARSVNIVLVPTLVQGEKAGERIASAIKLANEFNVGAAAEDRIEVLIVGRGGGSAEDLWAFNEEQVARAIRASEIPVISAVGHEVDFTISDLAADLRAPTPSAAAEIVAKAEAEVKEHLRRSSSELMRSMNIRVLAARADMQSLAMAPVFSEFPARLRELAHRLEGAIIRAGSAVSGTVRDRYDGLHRVTLRLSPLSLSTKIGETKRRLGVIVQLTRTTGGDLTSRRAAMLENAMARLDAMSPLRVLDRGYSIAQAADGRIIRDSREISIGDRLSIRFAKGGVGADVVDRFDEVQPS